MSRSELVQILEAALDIANGLPDSEFRGENNEEPF